MNHDRPALEAVGIAPPSRLATAAEPRVRFVGLGSPHGDDRAGWEVADRLAAVVVDPRTVRQAAVPTDLFDGLDDCDRLVVCDACRSGDRPGTATRRIWPLETTLPLRSSGTHAFGLVDVLRMAETLGRLPREVVVWTIEGRDFAPGSLPSADVSRAIVEVAERLLHDEFGAAVRHPRT